MMNIEVNGTGMAIPDSTSVSALLETLGIESARAVVELNEAIVDRASFAETILGEGDTVEIVRFVGGG